MMHACKIALWALIWCVPYTAAAVNGGMDLVRIAVAAKQQNAVPATPWIGSMRIADSSADDIYLADGRRLMKRPGVVHSYSETVEYDVSRFYRPNGMQAKMVLHYAGRTAGEIFSVGFDTGFSAEKIRVNPALFVGYTRTFQVAKQTLVAVGAGGWVGGKVSENPCRDEYNRAYYCPTLTAWSDHRQSRRRLQQHFQLMVSHSF
ncbi:hypothetical protein [Candidatus Mycalebacterium sp.]